MEPAERKVLVDNLDAAAPLRDTSDGDAIAGRRPSWPRRRPKSREGTSLSRDRRRRARPRHRPHSRRPRRRESSKVAHLGRHIRDCAPTPKGTTSEVRLARFSVLSSFLIPALRRANRAPCREHGIATLDWTPILGCERHADHAMAQIGHIGARLSRFIHDPCSPSAGILGPPFRIGADERPTLGVDEGVFRGAENRAR
jgi:hypothetical protein